MRKKRKALATREIIMRWAQDELARRGLDQSGDVRMRARKLGWVGEIKHEAWLYLGELAQITPAKLNGLRVHIKAKKARKDKWTAWRVAKGIIKPANGKAENSYEAFQAFYQSKEWRKVRYEALKKSGAVCQCCKATNKPIHVDHIKPRSKFPELELDLNNLQVLCEDCNMGKGGWDQTDWRRNP